MTKNKIRADVCLNITRDVIKLVCDHAIINDLPKNMVVAIPLGAAACLAVPLELTREQILEMLKSAYDDIEKVKTS